MIERRVETKLLDEDKRTRAPGGHYNYYSAWFEDAPQIIEYGITAREAEKTLREREKKK